MRDELLDYYENELTFLRQMGAEFAQKNPRIAARLRLEPDRCDDPHVERLIEAFAFLTARVHRKLNDEFPEVTESLLNVLYPHYLAPIPSMAVARFALDPEQGKLTTGYHVPRETRLYSRPIQGTPCRFRTSYPVTLWPVEVASAALEARAPADTRGRWPEAVIRISLRCLNETTLGELTTAETDDSPARPIESLRFYLNGEPQLVYPLYEMLFNNAVSVELRAGAGEAKRGARRAAQAASLRLPVSSLRAVGFEEGEAVLPYPARSFAGYRLLTEYFTFPEKFLFFDVTGLRAAAETRAFGDHFDILVHLRDITPPRPAVDAAAFQLGCTPVINLFTKIAEPIRLTQEQHEYRVIADVHRQAATEVYSVDAVTTTDPYLKQSRHFQPFYSVRHAEGEDDVERTFWYATRRASERENDRGTEVYLSLVDLGFNPHVPSVETVTVHTTLTNRDLPAALPPGGPDGDFDVEGTGPLARVRCLRRPTETVRPPLRRGAHWRLISHLSLNHLSITEGPQEGDAAEALREILLLYDFTGSRATRQQVAGLRRVTSRRVVRQTGSRVGTGFVRGMETTVEFDEENFSGGGVFLFASVLERFLGLYVSVNSFNQLVATTRQREGTLRRWQPRAGDLTLL
ncbi:MAG TPA: type VI secretion system baseplate subunit TssF [Pyrinomonadaceae bacterium]|nr:type VI secretion system baseplate subunit TssF [Pyrinomonadaceae bacterium]